MNDIAAARSAFLFMALCMVFTMPAVALACPGCKEALFEPGKLSENLATARSYALSIMLMLAVPVALLGTITTLVVRARRRH